MKDMIEIDIQILRETDKAIFVSDGDNESWIPKSQIECEEDIENKIGKILTINIPEWLAFDSDLI